MVLWIYGRPFLLKWLVAIVGKIAQYALHGAVQYAAEVVDGFCGNILVVFQTVESAVGEVMPAGERVPVFRRVFQSFPKRGVINHL